MIRLCKNRGFSLTEVLLSVGILSVGMIFIAGVFPVAIHFTTISTERTIAAIAADEAFAKIKIYATGDPSRPINLFALSSAELRPNGTTDFNDIFPAAEDIDLHEFTYPSAGADITQKQYFWSALCRLTEDNPNPPVQVTVFVCRKVSPHLEYPKPPDGSGTIDWPKPIRVEVDGGSENNELEIDNSGQITFINDGYTIVDDATGRIYRVLERYRDNPDTILLDRDWDGSPPGGSPNEVWVVPPPVGGGRYPCIAIYQKAVRF
jgi:prepilin-type N-terminal cleavage/methylation domain-containing protein